MWGGCGVYILFCAISLLPLSNPVGLWNTHNQKPVLPAECIYAHSRHVCACMGTDQVNREKTRCQLQKWSCLVGEGEPGRLREPLQTMRFSPSIRAGLGEWLFKTLGSFYFTTMEVNSVLKCQSKWSHLVSTDSLCISAAGVRLEESWKGPT